MRTATLIGLGLGFLMMVAGCGSIGPRHKAATTTTTEIKDSVSVVYTVRIDTVTVPGDTVTVTDVIECDSVTNKPKPKTLRAFGHRAHVVVAVDSTGQLTAQAVCDQYMKIILSQQKEIFRLQQEKRQLVRQINVPVYKTYWYDPPARVISLILVCFVAGYTIIKLKTKFL